ncbi:uroplakin-3b [Silurus meridionalis]|uniref:Uroplakin 3b n=1 Tax=Silurus meridionalis TaxID=175797 RepID=A0A8T0A9U3_SILME|nr:uroplakin-3b [Silurus meridionalis]KAF7688825.1 hypothetical protein HF521_013632 [Silurus meridionalis]
MKAYQVVCLICMIILHVFAIAPVNFTPTLLSDVTAPVTTNTVYLKKPFCSFDNITDPLCGTPSTCNIWLVSALGSAMSTFDSSKTNPSFISLSPYPTAFKPGQNNYSITKVGLQNSFVCSAAGTTPSYFLVGADGACNTANCNGVLPQGSTMSFKYLLVSADNVLVAETNWLTNITLKTLKDPDSLGSGYAGRSAAMVVITSILCAAAALILLLLLIALILSCCISKKKTQSYEARRQTSFMGSLRIPSYDVHHLKNPSPYDNPAYEQDLKKRYTKTSTLPQKTPTVITTVQSNSPDTINMQKM